MVSRSDELTRSPGRAASRDSLLRQGLSALIPQELAQEIAPSAHLALGFTDSRCGGAMEELPDPLGDANGPVALHWRVHPPASGVFDAAALHDLESTLRRWHDTLPAESHLLVAIPLSETEDPDASGGSLPPRRQLALRQVIRLLSECGFAIRKEKPLSFEEEDPLKTPRHWQLISSRKDPFHVRSYAPGDERAILELFPTCFHVQRGEEHWRWKYGDNPFGETAISLALSDQQELGAHYAGYAMPLYYQLDGRPRTFPVLQMGDTMTNPLFRHAGRGRNGLLARTVRHFFALQRGGPHGFFYGFNTGAIQRFCSWFIGGSKVEPVGYWRYERDAPPSTWNVHGYRVEPLHRAENELDSLFRRVAPHYGFLVQRDARYLQWRYLDCPDIDYTLLGIRRWRRLVGWGVFRRREGQLIWGDALIHPRHRRSAGPLLAAAMERFGEGTSLAIEAWFSRGPEWWTSRLPELGFCRQPQPQKLGFMALPDSEPGATEHLPELYYTMGDGDLF